MMQIEIDINDGEALSLTEDNSLLVGEGKLTRDRYSHIWPKSLTLRVAFRFVRALSSEKGIVSDWTRSWRCVWQVRLACTPRIIEFEGTRQQCVEWEHQNLEQTL